MSEKALRQTAGYVAPYARRSGMSRAMGSCG